MRTLTRGKTALVGAMAAGLALVGAPALAAPGEAPTLEVANDTFRAGSWGDGVEFTITDVPEGAVDVVAELDWATANGRGLVGEPVNAERQVDGSYTGTILPEDATPTAPDEDGFPVYTVNAYYTYLGESGEEKSAIAAVELTILEGLSVTGPAEATVAQLAEGVNLRLAGFNPNETVSGDIEFYDPETNTFESIGQFTATVGPDGNGEGELTIIGASVGNQFRVTANGAEGTVHHYITAVAEPGEETPGGPTPGGEGPTTPAPEAPRAPERVDTGA
ncbi:hypothetical protein [uncultured Aeromicrobium sp.]|uniref:hypothetical protein n=1 Tax=uncultured Aeromicrobium sp. TaxID=337820 RepID=UPI0025CDFEB2|nr:hypothetical protein [uncultured Aeromicrobium sp.]